MRLSTLMLVLTLATSAVAADWPHWRGPKHDGTTSEQSGWTGKDWPIVEAFRVNVGAGGSSPIIADGMLFAMGHDGRNDHVVCLDAATGKPRWKQSYPCPPYGRHSTGDKGMYRGPSSTPAFDPATGLLYTLSADGDLHCWNAKKKGARVWALDLYEKYGVGQRPQVTRRGGSRRDYGYTTAPLVHNDWLLVEVGDDEGNVMAFDKRTGQRVWTSQNKDPAGHTGGMSPLTVNRVPCVAVFTAHHLLVIRLDTGNEGKTVAEYPWRTDFINSIASPTAHGEHIIITAKYNQMRTVKLRITLDGAKPVWEAKPASGVCSPVVLGEHIYFANRGFWCLDAKTGDLKISDDKFGDAGSCIATGDGRIIVWASDGDLVLVESVARTGGEYKVLGEKRRLLRDTAWPHAALADGRLYCKDRAGNIICFAVSEKARSAVKDRGK